MATRMFDFVKAGKDASYVFAAPTGSTAAGYTYRAKALELFDASTPDEQARMRIEARGFLWSLEYLRPSK